MQNKLQPGTPTPGAVSSLIQFQPLYLSNIVYFHFPDYFTWGESYQQNPQQGPKRIC